MTEDARVTWLRHQLDAEDGLARCASERNGEMWWCPSSGLLDLDQDDQHRQDLDQIIVHDSDVAEHMAAHDPKRVKREVAVKRVLLEHILSLRDIATDEDSDFPALVERMLLCMLAPYAGRDGWREDWRVPGLDEDGEARVLEGELVAKQLAAEPTPGTFTAPVSGCYHYRTGQTPHLLSECTDACRAVGAPYVAEPGEIRAITFDTCPAPAPAIPQRMRPLHEPSEPPTDEHRRIFEAYRLALGVEPDVFRSQWHGINEAVRWWNAGAPELDTEPTPQSNVLAELDRQIAAGAPWPANGPSEAEFRAEMQDGDRENRVRRAVPTPERPDRPRSKYAPEVRIDG